ncbi:hypothetical protein D3C81_1566350 [compost metagenome]
MCGIRIKSIAHHRPYLLVMLLCPSDKRAVYRLTNRPILLQKEPPRRKGIRGRSQDTLLILRCSLVILPPHLDPRTRQLVNLRRPITGLQNPCHQDRRLLPCNQIIRTELSSVSLHQTQFLYNGNRRHSPGRHLPYITECWRCLD